MKALLRSIDMIEYRYLCSAIGNTIYHHNASVSFLLFNFIFFYSIQLTFIVYLHELNAAKLSFIYNLNSFVQSDYSIGYSMRHIRPWHMDGYIGV